MVSGGSLSGPSDSSLHWAHCVWPDFAAMLAGLPSRCTTACQHFCCQTKPPATGLHHPQMETGVREGESNQQLVLNIK